MVLLHVTETDVYEKISPNMLERLQFVMEMDAKKSEMDQRFAESRQNMSTPHRPTSRR